MDNQQFKFVIIGGGIAGVTCTETLSQLLNDISDFEDRESILLVAGSALVKTVTNFKQVSRTLEDFQIEEKQPDWITQTCPNVKVARTEVVCLDSAKHTIYTSDDKCYRYERLCIATGASPKLIAEKCPLVLGIRDTESVSVFQSRLSGARRVMVVGNGGIASELVYEIEHCGVIWAIKDDSINHVFLDESAAAFMLTHVHERKQNADSATPSKRRTYTLDKARQAAVTRTSGSALGPDWHSGLEVTGAEPAISRNVHIESNCEVQELLTPEGVGSRNIVVDRLQGEEPQTQWPAYVKLTNGKCFGCDLVVSATGVTPNTAPFVKSGPFKVAEDGGLLVDERMRTNVVGVYAAGDVCTVNWPPVKHWLQMRLWSQARQMGHYAAKCMLADYQEEAIEKDFSLETFAHMTNFFGFKVVLIGRFNAQGLGVEEYELLLRITPGKEYVKVVLQDGKMVGTVLIGETDLEETFENLIINEMDLTDYKEDLLDANVDIADYFD
ncbi:PREDICTED: pyridine nucleotide-disulfide oxidoreductase domain-containing protein 1-like [Priapulus caudatus]|uniref:Pyridine nucleotide-disulfide oxidoreductase domain-containing protein 1 n=1 Tax=Priapulus caudatus TaxID=37621 RepID=A0ABM1ET66_PRICU|nr:PREDICTED: pyridine nucleotide-disulfide oxidoreductase domain-containing protein 1-like [Priapulus caudatus]